MNDFLIEFIQKELGNKYVISKKLGEGSFGIIYQAQQQETKKEVAIKYIDKSQFEQYWSYIEAEVKIMSEFANENILQLYEQITTEKSLYMVIELAQMDLEQLWSRYFDRHISEDLLRLILEQLMNGFSVLHEKCIIHRDIKLENFMVFIEDINQLQLNPLTTALQATYKIGDFGLAKKLTTKFQRSDSYVGSIYTMAPEIQLENQYTIQVDMYSLGVIVYQLIEGNFPFEETFHKDLAKIIKEQNIVFTQNISESLKDLIIQMLKYDPLERIQWEQLASHKFFQKAYQSISPLKIKLRKQQSDYLQRKKKIILINQHSNKLEQTEESKDQIENHLKELKENIEHLEQHSEYKQIIQEINRSMLILQFVRFLEKLRKKNSRIATLDIMGEEIKILSLAKIVSQQMKQNYPNTNQKIKIVQKLLSQNHLNPKQKYKGIFKRLLRKVKKELKKNSSHKIAVENLIPEIKLVEEKGIKKALRQGIRKLHQNFKESGDDIHKQEFQSSLIKIFEQLNEVYLEVPLEEKKEIALVMIKAMKIWKTFDQDENQYIVSLTPGYYESQIRFRNPNLILFDQVQDELAKRVSFDHFRPHN